MTGIITSLTLIFVAASALLLLTNRRHSYIPAYIVAGFIIGRFIAGQELLGLVELGIAFLVFLFGIRMEPGRIRSVAEESFATAIVQVAVVGTAVFIAAQGLNISSSDALYVTIAASLSSSIVGLQLIHDRVEIQLLHGRLAESINLVQDLLAVAIILAISVNSTQSFLAGLGIIATAIVFRSTLFRLLMKIGGKSTEMVLLTGLTILTAFVGAAQLTGLSIVIGSFAGGLACARFPDNLEVLETLNPLKDFFSTIFFVTLGALVTFPSPETLVLTTLILAATVALKPAITALMLLINGYDRRTSYLTALTLDQVSEFALMIVITAYAAGTVSSGVFNAVILAAALTMMSSAYTTQKEESIYRFVSSLSRVESSPRKIEERTEVPEDLEGHIILAGFDTQGKRLAETLNEEGAEFLVVENDPEKITEAKKNHENYVFGDVMDDDTWEKAKIDDAKLIVSTIPVKKVSEKILELDTDAEKILRSGDIDEAADLLEAGATYVEVPDVVASEQLIDHLKGVLEKENYREELRRRNLLEVRRYLEQEEG